MIKIFIYESKKDSLIIAIRNAILLILPIIILIPTRIISDILERDIFDAKYLGYLCIIGMISFFFPFYSNGLISIKYDKIKLKKHGKTQQNLNFKNIKKITFSLSIPNKYNYNSFGQVKCNIKTDNCKNNYEFYFQRYLTKQPERQMFDFINFLNNNIKYELPFIE